MVLGSGHQILQARDEADAYSGGSVSPSAQLFEPFLTHGDPPTERVRGVFDQLNLQNGTMGQHTSILNKVASWGKSDDPKSFEILNTSNSEILAISSGLRRK